MPERRADDHIAQAKKLRHRAEECRNIADLMSLPGAAAAYVELANAYDLLAEQEEQLADVLQKKRSDKRD